MRITHIILATLFALFAVAQLNDPDPVQWFLAYAMVSALFAAAAAGRRWRTATAITAAMLTVWMFTLLPGFVDWMREGMPSMTGSMKATEQHIEVVREFLGLLIAVSALIFLLRKGDRRV
jgi:hypothetical protein